MSQLGGVLPCPQLLTDLRQNAQASYIELRQTITSGANTMGSKVKNWLQGN